jgi:hypothetical protein
MTIMARKLMTVCASALLVLFAVACAGQQPTQETQEQAAPPAESTAQAPAQEGAPVEGTEAQPEMPAAEEGAAPAEEQPQY